MSPEAICKQLLLKNAKVYLAARSESKARAALEELEKETGKKAIFLKLDLSDLDATKKSAQEFLEYVLPLPPTRDNLTGPHIAGRKPS